MRRTFISIAVLMAGVLTSIGGAQIRYLSDAPGVWKPFVFRAYANNRTRVAARAADIKALEHN